MVKKAVSAVLRWTLTVLAVLVAASGAGFAIGFWLGGGF
jgi:hypothetical protein